MQRNIPLASPVMSKIVSDIGTGFLKYIDIPLTIETRNKEKKLRLAQDKQNS